MTDAGLACLKRVGGLRSLDLCSTQITNDGLKHLEELVFLQKVEVSGTQVTSDRLLALRKALRASPFWGR